MAFRLPSASVLHYPYKHKLKNIKVFTKNRSKPKGTKFTNTNNSTIKLKNYLSYDQLSGNRKEYLKRQFGNELFKITDS
jgi:hypothetical protein